ncbi:MULTISPECIES: TolC family protein [Sulfurimonadaceae]|uniref:TolC family protein n=1 Tax=Sulfurimonadaceae TaxID=2771471 RepID=UPI00262DE690|nr:TolC family protein [Sulfurimonas sp.]MDD4856311.1 TolC family protein [Sulfuricurvum sp.]MDD5157228.1 TolC family protein [Sulfurimonas sp.]
MIKIILSLSLYSAAVMAESFDLFLEQAIEKSPYLNASSLRTDQAILEGSKLTRYENPTLEVERSRFKSDNGYRLGLNQPVRVWGVGEDKERIARSLSTNAKANVAVERSRFIKELSLLYVDYAQAQKLLNLANEELKIAQSINNVSKERYAKGSLSKALMLQADVAYSDALSNRAESQKEAVKSYDALREYAGFSEEIAIDADTNFIRFGDEKSNPDLALLTSENDLKASQAKLETRIIESVGVFTEYEKEPDQNIYRAGVSIPLPIFNTKREEKSIQELQIRQNVLFFKAQNDRLGLRKKSLLKEITSLETLLQQRKENLKNAQELLGMYQDAYAIANVNLLELYEIKNRRIATQEEIISLQSQINRSTIEYNYLQGAYNE